MTKTQCRAHTVRAINRGILKQSPCKVCGSPKVEIHHLDYRSPLKVEWLCERHHLLTHFPSHKKGKYVIMRMPQKAHAAARLYCKQRLILLPGFLQAAVLEKIQRENGKKPSEAAALSEENK